MIGNRAIFEINIKNMGSGKVLSPYADLRSCGSLSLGRQDMDKVGYTVRLGSGGFGDCKPQNGLVQLHNGQGKILCKFNVPGAVAYETPLSVDLDYNYLQSYDKPIQIVKTPE